MSIRATLFALAGLIAASVSAQDSLFYTNGTVIVGQVEEIGLDAVKYRTSSDGHPVVIEVDKHDLAKVKLKDGQAYTFTSSSTEPRYSEAFLGRKHALSLDVIAPALNHLTVGYEQVLGPRTSLVVKAGYIGLWKEGNQNSDMYNSTGGLLTAGVKFTLPRSAKRMTPPGDAHPLAGWYLRPELLFSAWTTTSYSYGYPDPYYPYPYKEAAHDHTSAALVLNIGKELFLSEHVTFDFSGGLGYGLEWRDGSLSNGNYYYQDRQEYAFSHSFLGDNTPLVLTGGLRFGYVF